MSEQPLDLRSLADIDSPDVVRAALRTFRRRVILRSLWGLLAGMVAVAIIYVATQPRSLPDRITKASVAAHPGVTWDVGDVRIALVDVARLDDHLGLHFVVLGKPGSNAASIDLDPTGLVTKSDEGQVDRWLEVRLPVDGTIDVEVFEMGRCRGGPAKCFPTFEIDLAKWGIPDEVWR